MNIILYRPIGPRELELIKQADYKRFPPRLPGQPIFYPVLQEKYANEIAEKWNFNDYTVGYVTRFIVNESYLLQYDIKTVGGSGRKEYWIPADELDEFNNNIIGYIKVVREFIRINGSLTTIEYG